MSTDQLHLAVDLGPEAITYSLAGRNFKTSLDLAPRRLVKGQIVGLVTGAKIGFTGDTRCEWRVEILEVELSAMGSLEDPQISSGVS